MGGETAMKVCFGVIYQGAACYVTTNQGGGLREGSRARAQIPSHCPPFLKISCSGAGQPVASREPCITRLNTVQADRYFFQAVAPAESRGRGTAVLRFSILRNSEVPPFMACGHQPLQDCNSAGDIEPLCFQVVQDSQCRPHFEPFRGPADV